MMLERRNPLRRKLCGGVVAGAIAGLWAGAAEAVIVSARTGAPPVRVAWLLGLSLLGGVIMGATLGVLVAILEPVVDGVVRRRRGRPRAAALVYAAASAPGCALLAAHLVPAHGESLRLLGQVGAGIGLITSVFGALWIVTAAGARIELRLHQGQGQIRWALAGAVVAVVAGVACLGAATRFGGDPVLRAVIEAVGVGFMILAVSALSLGARAGERRWARLAAPRGAAAVAIVAVMAGAWSLTMLSRPERADVFGAIRREVALVGAFSPEADDGP
jgi:hypothetical protein